MPELSKRQEYLLGLIVREYVVAPTPVSSKALVDKYGLNVSSATVRNDMATLEELGLIISPHTSAGRVPTEQGYRYFVQRLIRDRELTVDEERMIQHQFHQARLDIEQWLRLAASVLAHTAGSASLITSPVMSMARLKHLQLINTQGRLVLMVLVLDGGDVRQQMLTFAEPIPQDSLSQVASDINAMCEGLQAQEIRAKARHEPTLAAEVMDLVSDLMDRADKRHRVAYYDGLANILDPVRVLNRLELSDPIQREEMRRVLDEVDSPGARQTLHLLEQQNLLEEILSEALAPNVRGVQVVIGGEGRWEDMDRISLILSNYGVQGQAMGTLGVLGPTRLHYGRAISAVRYVAGLMSDMLIDIYGEGEALDREPDEP
jgi:heat-inducible transcriptional repressor